MHATSISILVFVVVPSTHRLNLFAVAAQGHSGRSTVFSAFPRNHNFISKVIPPAASSYWPRPNQVLHVGLITPQGTGIILIRVPWMLACFVCTCAGT